MELPRPFLISRFSDSQQNPEYNCICPGFELKKWRFERLAAHLIDWLPDFAINHADLPPSIENITDYRKLIETAAERIYKTEKSEHRGEIGELLLHAACRQFSGTFPAVAKIYYKDWHDRLGRGKARIAKKPGTNPKGEFAFFNIFYEDDSQRSNRRVPAALIGGLDGEQTVRAYILEQDREISEKSGKEPLAIKKIEQVGAKKK